MLASTMRGLFRRPPLGTVQAVAVPIESGPAPTTEAALPEARIQTAWPVGRLTLTDQLWGPGFIFPGGEIETLRLTRPLGLSAAASLLIVGVGNGGPAAAAARNLGAWVTGMDTDPSLLTAARVLIQRAQMTKKVSIKAWDPANPAFEAKTHHHCLALEPFQRARPEPILDGLARVLKPGGQMVITGLTAPVPLDPADPTVRRWADLDHRDPTLMVAPISVTRMLGRVGLDVRVAEDMSQRHLDHAMLGWRVLLRDLDRKPSRQEAVQLVREAELWLLLRRLIKDGRLRMMRWHAISHVPIV
ncbi:class I SAM-dependent methyltransferase [Acidisphaera sp. S103]|uniref:class I SAM-dependent methyltransferase n=1 Tax=Acidisphaera sp. S103 TaxID=1747223 RepID=UPI00131E1052|nr:class I SAM-dependent methyltransferase [Acidisphaera sp. S103]